jgi:hypothetical protein
VFEQSNLKHECVCVCVCVCGGREIALIVILAVTIFIVLAGLGTFLIFFFGTLDLVGKRALG